MKKYFAVGFFLTSCLLLPVSSYAQFTTVTATVQDPNGIPYAGAVLNAVLVPSTGGGYTLSGQPYSGRIGPVTLDSAGKFTVNFGDVTLITPGSPQWQITIDSAAATIGLPLGTGPQSFTYTSTGTTISGSSPVSLTSALNALAPKLTNFVAAGSVTSASCGNLSPLFNCSVATPTSTPAFSFTQQTESANQVFAGPTTGAAANPTFRTLVDADVPASLQPAQAHMVVAKDCANLNLVVTQCFVVADDVKIVTDASWAATATVTVTTGAGDPPFLSTGNVYPATCSGPSSTCDVGKTAEGTYNCNGISPQQCFTAIAQGTITSITSAHVATLSSTASHASSTGSGITYFAWGTIDTTALQAANDAAMTSTSPTDIQLPCGSMFFDNVLFTSARVTRSIYPIGIKGCTGNGSTTLVPLANMTCPTGVCFIHLNYTPGQNSDPFWSDAAENINFFGLGLDVPGGSGFTGTSHQFIRGIFSTTFRNVTGIGYLWNRTSSNTDYGFECIGCRSDGTVAFVFGNKPCHLQGAAAGEMGYVEAGYCGGSAFTSVTVDGANPLLLTTGMAWDTPLQNDGTVLSATTNVPTGATLHWQDEHSYNTGCSFFAGGTTDFDGTYLNPSSGACSGVLTVTNSAATLTVRSIHYTNASGFPWLILSAGTVYDGCTNTGNYTTGGNAATITGGTLINCGSEPSVSGRCLLASAAGPLACGNSATGKVAIPTTTTSYVINTSAVLSGSTITITPTTDNTGIPGSPTCVLPTNTAIPSVSATVAGTSFTIAQTFTTGITCYDWTIR